MTQWPKRRPVWFLGTGFLLGLLVGVGMLVGSMATWSVPSPRRCLSRYTTARDGNGQQRYVCHGNRPDFENGVEGVFFLDFLTGDLQCWVLNSRNGQLGGQFRHNVVQDLGVEQGKKPRYLMVTGAASFRRGTSGLQPADSIVYVADANTGHFAAYALPWNRQAGSPIDSAGGRHDCRRQRLRAELGDSRPVELTGRPLFDLLLGQMLLRLFFYPSMAVFVPV